MSDISSVGAKAAGVDIRQVYGGAEKIIDVKSGESLANSGRFTVSASTTGIRETTGIGDLTPSQAKDLEKLLEILGITAENAKTATAATVLKAIASNIRAQTVITSTQFQISDYDTARLTALRDAYRSIGGYDANKAADNLDAILDWKNQLDKGVLKASDNYKWFGDRIGDFRLYSGRVDSSKVSAALDKCAPAMKKAALDIMGAYQRTSGWSSNTWKQYAENSRQTIKSFIAVLKSDDLKLPSQISKDALVEFLESLLEETDDKTSTAEILEKLEEKIKEIEASLADVALENPIKA